MERRLGSWSFRVVRNRGHKTNKYTLSCVLRCGEGVHASEGGWWEFWGGTLRATTAESMESNCVRGEESWYKEKGARVWR